MMEEVPENNWMVVRFNDNRIMYHSPNFQNVIDKANELDEESEDEYFVTKNLGLGLCVFKNGRLYFDGREVK